MKLKNRNTKIFEILKETKISNNSKLEDVLNAESIAILAIKLDNKLDKTNEFYAIDFNEQFNVEQEKTNIVNNFEYSELSFRLLLEEVLEYAFALNLKREEVYNIFISLFKKQFNKSKIKTNEEQLKEVFDSLADILVITYGRFHVLNAKGVSNKLMEEVYNSNMSKFCKDLEDLKLSIAEYKSLDVPVQSKKVGEKFLIFNEDTKKILKSINFKKPKIKKILKQFKIL